MAANEERRRKIPWTIFAALVYASFYIPVLVMILFSFNDAKRNYYWVGFTTEWYSKLFSFGNHLPFGRDLRFCSCNTPLQSDSRHLHQMK